MKAKASILLAIIALLTVGCGGKNGGTSVEEKEPTILFGINADLYEVETLEVQSGQTWTEILESRGITRQTIDRLNTVARDVHPLNRILAGKSYHTFSRRDGSDSTVLRLDYVVYEKNRIEYVIYGFTGDSVSAVNGAREVLTRRQKKTATIESSLYGAIVDNHLPFGLAPEMEDIYQWTVDFFGIQKGDSFTVIYDENFVDTLSIGIGRIWGAKFSYMGKDIYAIPFPQDGKVQYWEKDGTSLRKQLLKAPLKFSRVSSKFTHARYHPVLHRYMPHTGVDYAAPAGTPVRSVADGTVTFKGYKGAGGNTVKIKHANGFSSAYMHLKGYAGGIAAGKRVSQGQVIGYVGSTGRSTGPHLDFRLWKGSTPINPLKVPQQPSTPIRESDREKFNSIRDRIIAELEGDIEESRKVKQIDSI